MLGTKIEGLNGLAVGRNKILSLYSRVSRLSKVRNSGIRSTLDIEETITTANCYKMNWRDHVLYMYTCPPDRIPRAIVQYTPRGKLMWVYQG